MLRNQNEVKTMAKRSLIDHPKFAEFKILLGANKSVALGYLECLWQFTGRYTAQGNIGKYKDSQIEAWLEWDGEPGKLIESFIESGFLDRHEKYRLLVHDWQDHVDNTTRTNLKRSGLDVIMLQQCCDSVEAVLTPPVPEPVPVPVPVLKEQLSPQAGTARFKCPSLEEVALQFRTKGCGDPDGFAEDFFNYYESVNWVVGKKRMVKWKAAVGGWISRSKNRGEWVEAPPVQIVQQPGIDYIAVNGVQMELDGVTPFNVRAWRQKKRIEMGLVSA